MHKIHTIRQGSGIDDVRNLDYRDGLNTVIIESKEYISFGGTVDRAVVRNKLEDCWLH